jgi:hypothetical protein
MNRKSPFYLSDEDAQLVQQNREFRVVRAFLATRGNSHSYVSFPSFFWLNASAVGRAHGIYGELNYLIKVLPLTRHVP